MKKIIKTTSQKRAREIMVHMFGINDAIKHFRVNPTRRQVAALSEIPFTEMILKECRKTHILVAVFPISIRKIRGDHAKLFYHDDPPGLEEELFAEKGKTEWRLIRKTPVRNSTSKTWYEQYGLLSDDEDVPEVRVMVYAIIGHFLATGERLFEKIFVVCADMIENYNIYINFGSDGFFTGLHLWDEHSDDNVGISSARNPSKH